MTIYHYSGCSTCKKAIAFLAGRGQSPTKVDLVATPPDGPSLDGPNQDGSSPDADVPPDASQADA